MAEDFSASIEDYLVGLAASLQYAQRQLNEFSTPGDGSRPSVSYQLPKLDFELKLALELTQESTSSSGSGVSMRARLLNATGSRTQLAEAASVIKGSFVAVPFSGGKPPPKISTTLKRFALNQFSVTVKVETATGEPLAGIDVHFNTDRQLASKLNLAPSTTSSALNESDTAKPPSTIPMYAVVKTDADGTAMNVVDASAEINVLRVPITIDALGQSTTVVFAVERASTNDPTPTPVPGDE